MVTKSRKTSYRCRWAAILLKERTKSPHAGCREIDMPPLFWKACKDLASNQCHALVRKSRSPWYTAKNRVPKSKTTIPAVHPERTKSRSVAQGRRILQKRAYLSNQGEAFHPYKNKRVHQNSAITCNYFCKVTWNRGVFFFPLYFIAKGGFIWTTTLCCWSCWFCWQSKQTNWARRVGESPLLLLYKQPLKH